MKVALGLKAHSGWSALVVIGISDGEPLIIDRRRIDLVEPKHAAWEKQPYHAADGLAPNDAQELIKHAIQAIRRTAILEMRAAIKRSHEWRHDIVACAVLVPASMPDWDAHQILAVHFRMHKAEGALFPDALARAADVCGLRVVLIPEGKLDTYAEKAFRVQQSAMMKKINELGKAAGSPWGKDQKNATLAALVALHGGP